MKGLHIETQFILYWRGRKGKQGAKFVGNAL